MTSRGGLIALTLGAFLAGGVCLFLPVEATSFHSEATLRGFAWAELAVGAFGMIMLAVLGRRARRAR